MLAILEFTFSGFWTFIGIWILFTIAASAAVGVARAIMRAPVIHNTTDGVRK